MISANVRQGAAEEFSRKLKEGEPQKVHRAAAISLVTRAKVGLIHNTLIQLLLLTGASYSNTVPNVVDLTLMKSGHSAINPKLVECCSDGCPSGSFSHLHTGSLKLCQSDHQVLGHLPYQSPIAQFGQVASSRKSPGCPKLFPFKNYGGQCALGNPQCRNLSELCRQFL